MALFDNRHWLLSYIRKNFINSDESGMCEAVMICDNIAKQIPVKEFDRYPCVETDEEDEWDAMAQSLDLNSGALQFGLRRHRSNTAQRLEKMKEEKKKLANTVHVKWVKNPVPLSAETKAALFPKKDLTNVKRGEHKSLLTELLEKYPDIPENPFKKYARLDGNAQFGMPTKRHLIFLLMLNEEDRKYPMEVVVLSSAKIKEVVGFVCWKIANERPEITLKDDENLYALYIAEDDGSVDWEFPSLDSREVVSKFSFTYLAFVEREKAVEQDESFPILIEASTHHSEPGPSSRAHLESQFEKDQEQTEDDIEALKAPVFQPFNVFIYNKVRAKSEIVLGISGEKLEITPVVQSNVSTRFLGRKQKAKTIPINDIVSCDVIEHKSHNRTVFRLAYCRTKENKAEQGTIKNKYFETGTTNALEIVRKVNNILENRSSPKRSEYIASRERKSQRKKSFHLGSR